MKVLLDTMEIVEAIVYKAGAKGISRGPQRKTVRFVHVMDEAGNMQLYAEVEEIDS